MILCNIKCNIFRTELLIFHPKSIPPVVFITSENFNSILDHNPWNHPWLYSLSHTPHLSLQEILFSLPSKYIQNLTFFFFYLHCCHLGPRHYSLYRGPSAPQQFLWFHSCLLFSLLLTARRIQLLMYAISFNGFSSPKWERRSLTMACETLYVLAPYVSDLNFSYCSSHFTSHTGFLPPFRLTLASGL